MELFARLRTFTFAALFFLCLTAPALADSGGYVGAGFGWSKADLGPVESTADEVDDETSTLHAFVGYRPFRFFALELFYADIGAYSADAGSGRVETDTDGEGVAALVFLPLTAKTDVFVKLGVWRWDVEGRTFFAGVETGRARHKQTEPMYGIGLQLAAPDPAASLRLEYAHYIDVGEGLAGLTGADIGVVSVALVYSF